MNGTVNDARWRLHWRAIVWLLPAFVTGSVIAGEMSPTVPPFPPPGAYDGMSAPGKGMMPSAPSQGPYGRGHADEALPPVPPPFAGVVFTAEQRNEIAQMMRAEREAHNGRVVLMREAQAKLDKLYQADEWNTAKILAAYDELYDLQRKTIEAMAMARNKIYGMMSNEQREQLRQLQRQRMQYFVPLPQP